MSGHTKQATTSSIQKGTSADASLSLTALTTTRRQTTEAQDEKIEVTVTSKRSDAPKLVIKASWKDTVEYLQNTIFAHTGILPQDQHIELNGKTLESALTLDKCGLKPGSELDVSFTSAQAETDFSPTTPSQSRQGTSLAPPAISTESPTTTTSGASSFTGVPPSPSPTLPAWVADLAAPVPYKRRGGGTLKKADVVTKSASSSAEKLDRRGSNRTFSISGFGSIFRRGSTKKVGRGPVLQKESEAEKMGLYPRARAEVLKEWDGIIPLNPGQRGVIPKGLKLHFDRPVIIGRVVNQDWYQGYDPHDHLGYFPRNHVRVIDVMDDTIISELGSDAPANEPKPHVPHVPSAPLPSSPFPASPGSQPAYDQVFSQTRVSVVFTTTPATVSPYPLSISFTLVAAPNTRISSAIFRTTFPDGVILDLQPTSLKSDGTQVQHSDSKGTEIDLSIGTPSNLPAQGSATWKNTGSQKEDYARTTWGRIEGSGVGFPVASWVFEEDLGAAGRHGVPILKTTQELSLGLNVRPVMCEYEVDVTVVKGEGEKPGFFNSETHRSGKQKVFLP